MLDVTMVLKGVGRTVMLGVTPVSVNIGGGDDAG